MHLRLSFVQIYGRIADVPIDASTQVRHGYVHWAGKVTEQAGFPAAKLASPAPELLLKCGAEPMHEQGRRPAVHE